MTAEFHYREQYPKELRIQIQNEDEFNLLRLIFQDSFSGILKRYKQSDLEFIGLDNNWKKKFIQKSRMALEGEAYDDFEVYTAFEEETENMKTLGVVDMPNIVKF